MEGFFLTSDFEMVVRVLTSCVAFYLAVNLIASSFWLSFDTMSSVSEGSSLPHLALNPCTFVKIWRESLDKVAVVSCLTEACSSNCAHPTAMSIPSEPRN
jgi:hypothetical protein